MSNSNSDNNNNNILYEYEPASCFDKLKTRGRPKMVLNATGIKLIESLAMVQCTHEEIAACLGTTKETLYAKHNEAAFYTAYKKGSDQGKMSLRRMQFELAKSSAAMAIFLGKQMLGQKDNPEESDSNEKVNVVINFGDTSGGGETP